MRGERRQQQRRDAPGASSTVLTVVVARRGGWRTRPQYNRWTDAAGADLVVRARVRQTGVDRGRGALRTNQGAVGTVVELRKSRLAVQFDGQADVQYLWPHLVTLLQAPETSS
ncbi:hypothetical protein D5S17_23235 [Pseudonocardiaceae bacterium YIM PH 21723]|nr:hypothetical protein D5S17_23235 [Pseudonocardiaceae bacterium YIM PH 21723]